MHGPQPDFCFLFGLTVSQEEDWVAAVGRSCLGGGPFLNRNSLSKPLPPTHRPPASPSNHHHFIMQVFERVCRDKMPPYGLQLRSNKPTTMFRSGITRFLFLFITRFLFLFSQPRRCERDVLCSKDDAITRTHGNWITRILQVASGLSVCTGACSGLRLYT